MANRLASPNVRSKQVAGRSSDYQRLFRQAAAEQWTAERIDAECCKLLTGRSMLSVAEGEYLRGYKDALFWQLYNGLEYTYRYGGERLTLAEINSRNLHCEISESTSKYRTDGPAYKLLDGSLLPFHEYNRIADLPHLYTWEQAGFRAEFYAAGYDGERHKLAYRIYDDEEGKTYREAHNLAPLFYGREMGLPCSRMDDPPQISMAKNLFELLAWFTLNYGDTDRDYFDNYTPRQHAFRESGRREDLALIAYDMEVGPAR